VRNWTLAEVGNTQGLRRPRMMLGWMTLDEVGNDGLERVNVILVGIADYEAVAGLAPHAHMLSAAGLNESGGGSRVSRIGIDSIDPGYYTVADGNGQTTAARQAGIAVLVDALRVFAFGAYLVAAPRVRLDEGVRVRWRGQETILAGGFIRELSPASIDDPLWPLVGTHESQT